MIMTNERLNEIQRSNAECLRRFMTLALDGYRNFGKLQLDTLQHAYLGATREMLAITSDPNPNPRESLARLPGLMEAQVQRTSQLLQAYGDTVREMQQRMAELMQEQVPLLTDAYIQGMNDFTAALGRIEQIEARKEAGEKSRKLAA